MAASVSESARDLPGLGDAARGRAERVGPPAGPTGSAR
ncbi:hypothetical protein ABID74_001144 [Gordonia terrae]